MRLLDKLAEAKDSVAEITAAVEARADALIARKEELKRRTNEVFTPHEAILDQAASGLDAVEGALRLLSNGPLE